jgi:hypothetical protein
MSLPPERSNLTEPTMTESRNSSERTSRRVVLTTTALALGAMVAGTAVTKVAAQTKISQAAAKYQDHPKGKQSCDNCVNFMPPNACKFVQSPISPNGWCQLYAAKT